MLTILHMSIRPRTPGAEFFMVAAQLVYKINMPLLQASIFEGQGTCRAGLWTP